MMMTMMLEILQHMPPANQGDVVLLRYCYGNVILYTRC